MFGSRQAPFTITAAALMALQPILVSLSRNERGTFDYSVPASTMFSEVLKLVISLALLMNQRRREMATARRLMMESGVEIASGLLDEQPMREFSRYMTPGLIYFINNNLLFFILQTIDPTTFQLLSQMKTIFTGLLFWLFLKRRLT
jgi:UDP-sugar transporter A1/2/3